MSFDVDSKVSLQNQYNNKILSNSSWITKELLQSVLCDHFKDPDISVSDVDVKAAVGVGDNYLSLMYKTCVTFSRTRNDDKEKLHLMIKGRPTSKMANEFIDDLHIFTKELSMYSNCLPLMKKYQDEYFPHEVDFLAANSYKCGLESTIIMEDLIEAGYKMANRRQQLDYEHCVSALRSLARLHALSLKVNNSHPDVIESVSYEFYQEANTEQMAPFFEQCFPNFCDEMEKWPESARFVEVVRRLGKNCYLKIMKCVQPTEGCQSVLNHGDLWVNNMLFKYNDNGCIGHVKLVDFQISRYSSPAIDLIYFLFTSPKADVLTNRFYDLIEEYHTFLINDIKQLQLDSDTSLSLEQLHDEIRQRAYFAIVVIFTILPIVISVPDNAVDMDNITKEEFQTGQYESGEFPMLKNYRDAYYRETTGKLFVHLEKTGLLRDAEENTKHLD